jgi:hypothetical protein
MKSSRFSDDVCIFTLIPSLYTHVSLSALIPFLLHHLPHLLMWKWIFKATSQRPVFIMLTAHRNWCINRCLINPKCEYFMITARNSPAWHCMDERLRFGCEFFKNKFILNHLCNKFYFFSLPHDLEPTMRKRRKERLLMRIAKSIRQLCGKEFIRF